MRWLAFLLCAGPAAADSLVATRVIRAESVLTATDVAVVDAAIPGALASPSEAVGLEARVTLYPGRPVRAADIGPPALVERNAAVPLAYRSHGLTITAEGRALSRAGAGETLRVMNLASRVMLTGRLGRDGVVVVGPDS